MDTNSEPDALRSRWTLEGRIPLSGVAEGAAWRRARSVATGQDVVLFIVRGDAALEAADAVRRAYLVEDPRLLPVQEIVVLDDPRETTSERAAAADPDGPTTVVEYPRPPAPPLAALLARGPLHPETARAIIGEAATGLEAARRRGVRHQLIDSNRLFVDTRSGTVTILGVGVEAAAHAGLDRSREPASFQDTAALVALLYRALTGRSPQHDANGDVPRPSSVVDTEIPSDLDLLCDLVLNESADDVPETTRGLIEALEPWQSIPVTLEAYPRTSPAAPAAAVADEPVGQEDVVQGDVVEEDSADADAPQDSPAPSPSTEPGAGTDEDEVELESTALMDPVPEAPETQDAEAQSVESQDAEQLPEEEDAAGQAPAPSVPPAPELPAAAGAASGMAGAGAAAVAAASSDRGDQDDPVAHESSDTSDGEDESPADRTADEEERRRAAQAAEDKAQHHSAEAKSLVTDLHLDQKRSSTAFPGHLDITSSPGEQPSASPDSPSAAGAGALAAGGLAAGAAGAAADDPQAQDDGIPSRSSGTHWPLAGDAVQGERTALAPSQSPDGADGRAPQPSGAPTESSTATTPDHSAPTPSHPAAHGEGDQSPAPVAVTGRAVPVAPVHDESPIVIHGRGRSLLEDDPEESTVPSSRSSLLRDVVGVAVDDDAPQTFAMGPRDREKRSLQSQWIIIGGAIVVMVALVFAVTSVTRDIGGLLEDPLATSAPPTSAPSEETGEAPVEPTEEATEEPELPTAELTGVEVFAQGSDMEPDNADQQDRITDGDPSTFWSSKHYTSPQYGGLKEGVGVRLEFGEPSTLSAVTVTTARNNGGTIELRTVNDDGSLGDVLASGALAGDGELRLTAPEPLETERVALWISELPPDSNEQGRFRARIAEIQVE